MSTLFRRRQQVEETDSGFSIPLPDRTPYARRTQTNQAFYGLSGIGIVSLCVFTMSFLAKSPAGIAWLCGLAGVIGLASHWTLTYYSSKPKEFSFWFLWIQSAFLLSVAFYVGGKSCL
jgi:hypothetical protein